MVQTLTRIDHWLFLVINGGLGAEWLDPVFVGFSALGEWTIILVAVAFLANGGRRLMWRHLMAVLAVLVVLAPLHYGLKYVIQRDRPSRVFTVAAGETSGGEQEGRGTLKPRFDVEKGTAKHNSFPSGHSVLAFFFMTYVAMHRRPCRWWALGLAGMVALSRVYVGAHFPFDCLVGSLLGAAGGWAAWRVFGKFNQPSEQAS